MLKEFIFSVFIKGISFYLGLVLALKLDSGHSQQLLQLVYIIGILNLAKIFDLSIPYLLRIKYIENITILSRDFISVTLLTYSAMFVICLIAVKNTYISLFIVIYAFIFSRLSYYYNVKAKSYALNIPQILSLGVCLSILDVLGLNIMLVYVLLSIIFSVALYLIIDKDEFLNFTQVGFKNLIDKNYIYNVATMIVFILYAEFAAVILYGHISPEDYAEINKFTKVQLTLVGASTILTSVLWNKFHTRISKYDKWSISSISVVLVLCVFYILGFYAYYDFIFIEGFFNENYNLFIIIIAYVILSIFNLLASQILVRMSLSGPLLLISVLEAFSVAWIYFNWKDVLFYFSFLTAVYFLKLMLSKVYIYNNLIKNS